MKPNNPRHHKHADAFTLIELMVVIMIMLIVVGLIIGVAHYINQAAARKSTMAAEAIILQAVNTFNDDTGALPAATVSSSILPSNNLGDYYVSGVGGAGGGPGWPIPEAVRNMALVQALNTDPGAKAVMEKLQPANIGSWALNSGSTCQGHAYTTCPSGPVFIDGFGTPFDYQSAGSISGGPVIISAGADQMFGVWNGVIDDIRSDVH
jgi:prepilin-type N-terminal cleavage/methylation domain-containing protein